MNYFDCSFNQLNELDFITDYFNVEDVWGFNIKNNPIANLKSLDKKIRNIVEKIKVELPEYPKEFNKPYGIDQSKFQEKIATLEIPGEIKLLDLWWNDNVALVVNKVAWYAISVVIYQPKQDIIKSFKISEPKTEEALTKKLIEIEQQLNSDNPAHFLLKKGVNLDDLLISKIILLKKNRFFSDDFKKSQIPIKQYDIVCRRMKDSSFYHAGIYLGNAGIYLSNFLGNEKVANLSDLIFNKKFLKTEDQDIKTTKDAKNHLGARVENFADFLGEEREVKVISPIVPFSKWAEINERIIKSVLTKYGEKEYNLLKNNCEHYSTMCVLGFPVSFQVDDKLKIFKYLIDINSLEKKITETKKLFDDMISDQEVIEDLKERINNCEREVSIDDIDKTSDQKSLEKLSLQSHLGHFTNKVNSKTENQLTAQIEQLSLKTPK